MNRFRSEMESRLGEALAPPRPLAWHRSEDYLGWHPQDDGRWFYGLRVINGRIRDVEQQRIRSGLRALINQLHCEVRLTAQQNLLLTGIASEDRLDVTRLLRAYGVVEAAGLPPFCATPWPAPHCLPAVRPSPKVSESGRKWPLGFSRLGTKPAWAASRSACG